MAYGIQTFDRAGKLPPLKVTVDAESPLPIESTATCTQVALLVSIVLMPALSNVCIPYAIYIPSRI